MGLFANLGISDATVYPALNTCTPLDMATAVFEKGKDNKYYLMFGIGGRGGFYKSTVLDGLLLACLLNYPHSEGYKLDTEMNALAPKQRMKNACKYKYGSDFDVNSVVEDRLKVTNISATRSSEFEELIRNVCKYKEDHKKDYIVEIPFLDKDGNPLKMWIPTYIVVDSVTLFRSDTEMDKSTSISAEDKNRNMDALRDGMYKKRLIEEWSRISYRYGIYFLMSAQVDDSYVADEYNRPEKQNQFTKTNDRFKGVGPQFEFLTNTLLQNFAPTLVTSSTDRKAPEYGNEGAGLVEINELSTRVLRCKSAPAGTMIPMLASQSYGILPGLTYYHYLKKNGDFGFNVSGTGRTNRYSMLLPDLLLKRQNIISTLENNYELNRALEIMFQLKWMIDFWTTHQLPFGLPATAEEFVDRIIGGNDILISDILNTRGYWTYEDPYKRPYMSIFDILNLISSNK